MVTSEDQGLDEVILQVFEEHEESFHFPVATQKEARAFVKALHGKGLSYDSLLHEIKELEQNFSAWRKGISRPGIGNRVIERINRPLQEILLSDGEEEDPDYLDQLSSDSDEVESNLNGIEVKNNGENRLTPDWKSSVLQTGNGADSQKQLDLGATCSGNTSAAGAIQSDCKSQGNSSVEVYDKAIDVTKNVSGKTEEGQDKGKDGDIQKDAPLEKTKQDSSIAENKTIVGASGKNVEIIEKKQEAVTEHQQTVTEKKQEAITEHQQTVTEKKQEAGTERKQEAVIEKETATGKKTEVVTEKKLETAIEKKQEAVIEKKQEAVTEKKLETAAEKKLETAAEKKQEAATEKKQEVVTEKKLETAAEKKLETATEKKLEAAIEKKQEAVIEKKQEAVTEKKLETAAEKKQLVVAENKQEAVIEKKKETVTEKKEAVAEKKQEAVTETKQATTGNKLETVTEKKQNVVSGNKQEAVAEEKQISALTNEEKTAQLVIVENKEVDLQGNIVSALEEVQDQRANKQKFVESLEGEKCESGCPKKEIAGIAAQCKSEPPSDHVKRDEATLKEAHSTNNASKAKLEGEAASVSASNEVVSQNKNSEIESEVVEHRSVNVQAAELIDQTNLPEKEKTSASISTVSSSGTDAEHQKIKLDQLQCHPATSDGKRQGQLNDILESYNSDFDDELNHGSKCEVTTTVDDTSMTCGRPQVKNESQVGDGAGYVYVFTDSSAENVAYRVKVGASRFPHKKLQQALLFNIDMKLVSAVQVSDQRKALDAVHHQLNIFSIPKTVGWFCGPLESILNVLMAVAKDYPHQD